ncbi:hypothetical protein [Streptomyces sp. NPDC096311]|uniref:hypothetical protein n=1 Tax=Streptomyces sp. NPDC096311 TaxID=3366083 RepID=UPI00380DB110
MARRTVKTCSKCQESKTRDNFSKNRAAKDGLQSYCKECVRAYNQARNASNRPVATPTAEEASHGRTSPQTAAESFDEIVKDLESPALRDFPCPFEKHQLTEEQDEALAGILIALMRKDVAGSKFLMSEVCETWKDVTAVMAVLLELIIGVAGNSDQKDKIIWTAEKVIGDRVASRA